MCRLFVTPWTAACQASLSFTISWSLLKLISIELVMPSNHLILCRPLLLLPSIFLSIWVFSDESALVLLEEAVCYDQFVLLAKLCQPLLCFILYSKAKLACYSTYLLTSYFCIPISYGEKDIFFFFAVSSRRPYRSSQNWSTSASLASSNWGIDLDYYDVEWFALEMN